MFPTDYDSILEQIDRIDPVRYGSTRNFSDGAVTKLSPYISRGVISTKQVYQGILERGFDTNRAFKFIQELAWRDYWQQVWIEKCDAINKDMKRPQPGVLSYEMPMAIVKATTSIQAVDEAIEEFYETGYLHNHMRMYIAAIACSIGKYHWSEPAKWMYYHLLDADWASNALSWQWVAGANAGKQYVANQENINKYFQSRQRGTFLDVPYEAFDGLPVPEILQESQELELKVSLPKPEPITVDPSLPTCIYNFYNLDPTWRAEEQCNRVLLLEPAIFEKYPVSKKTIDFVMKLAENIEGIQVFVRSFEELKMQAGDSEIYYKEHPLNVHYSGTEDARDWMFSVKGYYPSFFGFFKKCKKELPKAVHAD